MSKTSHSQEELNERNKVDKDFESVISESLQPEKSDKIRVISQTRRDLSEVQCQVGEMTLQHCGIKRRKAKRGHQKKRVEIKSSISFKRLTRIWRKREAMERIGRARAEEG